MHPFTYTIRPRQFPEASKWSDAEFAEWQRLYREILRMALLRRNDVEQSLAAETQRLRAIETRIAQLETDGVLSPDDVIVRAEPAHEIVSLRRVVPSFAHARGLILEWREHAKPLLRGAPLTLLAVGHSPQF